MLNEKLEYQEIRELRKYLEKHPMVVVGYYGSSEEEIDCSRLLYMYITKEMEEHVRDDFQITEVGSIADGDTRTLTDLINADYYNCSHVAAWICGERVEDKEIQELVEKRRETVLLD